jgi:WD40 repeat protein
MKMFIRVAMLLTCALQAEILLAVTPLETVLNNLETSLKNLTAALRQAPVSGGIETEIERIYSIAYSPDGKTLALVGGGNLLAGGPNFQLWDVSQFPSVTWIATPFSGRTEILTSPQGNTTIPVISPDFYNVAYSSDGQKVATCSNQKVYVWDVSQVTTGKVPLIKSFGGLTPSYPVLFLGTNLLAVGYVEEAQLYNLTDTTKTISFLGSTAITASLAHNKDRTILASASSDDTIRLWDAATGKLLKLLYSPSDPVNPNALAMNTVNFSPDGNLLAAGFHNGEVAVWDTSKGVNNITMLKKFKAHNDFVDAVVFDRSNTLLATASDDKVVKIWDLSRGVEKMQETKVYQGHADHVNTIAFSPVANILASGSADGTIRFWTYELAKKVEEPTAPAVLFIEEALSLLNYIKEKKIIDKNQLLPTQQQLYDALTSDQKKFLDDVIANNKK